MLQLGEDVKFAQLLDHLKCNFEIWMNFDNYGIYNPGAWDDNDQSTWTWQIDHIIPHSFFNYSSMEDDNFKLCWQLKNLRPYSAKQNILDGNKRVLDRKTPDILDSTTGTMP
jgi:hypothetical protein